VSPWPPRADGDRVLADPLVAPMATPAKPSHRPSAGWRPDPPAEPDGAVGARVNEPHVVYRGVHHEIRAVILRLVGFVAGGALSYGLNLGVFLLLHERLAASQHLAYAISLTLVTGVNFAWSYGVNFRTDATIRSCLPRYAATLLSCYVLNYALARAGFAAWPDREKSVILGALVAAAGVKFVIYHLWVFPHRR
jgi:putative flippase GtrA